MAQYDYDSLGERVASVLIDEIPKYQAEKATNGNALSLRAVARDMDISNETLNSWMLGSSVPSLANAIMIADFFGMTLDELVGR